MPPDSLPSDSRSSVEDFATDIDVRTALALVRANTRAMVALSATARRGVVAAISDEIRLQEMQNSAASRLVAVLLKGHLAEIG
jgi:hypothetical protein